MYARWGDRCGYLHACLFALKFTMAKPAQFRSPMLDTIAQILDEGSATRGLHNKAGLMYTWHNVCYLGASHGICGVLMTLLQCKEALGALSRDPKEAAEALRAVHRSIDILLGATFPSGNLPSILGSPNDRLVQWCHGAPGLIPLLCSVIYTGVDDGRGGITYSGGGPEMHTILRDRLASAGDVIWARGLLKNGTGLCHGTAGNGYALLGLYRATGDERMLHRAEYFARWSMDHISRFAEGPAATYSLFEGLAGSVCFFLDVIQAKSSLGFPGYEI